MTLAELHAVMHHAPPLLLAAHLPYLSAALTEFEINTPLRKSAFVAQLAHESGELRYFEEIADGSAYEGRKDLGNTQPGDGKRFKGRGPIQLTGRSNYRAAGKALGLELENDPVSVSKPDVGFRVAGWFWRDFKGLNSFADGGPLTFDAITKRINGGLNGKAQRDAYYSRARQVFGC